MNNIMGMDLEALRILSVLGMTGAVLLYAYRVYCLVDLMKSESEKLLTGNNRLIYAGLIVFIPLGIGAWLFEFVVNGKRASAFFIVPFVLVLYALLFSMYELLPIATNFNFNYLGW